MNNRHEINFDGHRHKPLALIVVPTKGLVQYIFDVIIELCNGTSIKCVEMHGVEYNKQRKIMVKIVAML